MPMKDKKDAGLLQDSGCRKTKARVAVLEALEKAQRPLAAEEIFLILKEKGYATNLSTVYRTLELMEGKNLVEKSITTGNKGHYQLISRGHKHHLVCTGCHRMVPIDACPLERLEKEIGRDTRFDITGHKLEIYGVCPDCKKIEFN